MDVSKGMEKLSELISKSSDNEKELIGKVIEYVSEIDGCDLNTNFITGLIGDYIEVAEKLEVVTNEVEQAESFNELTMIYNQKMFRDKLNYEIARKSRYDYSLSVIYIDLDGFKEINDIYGHKKGESILKAIGMMIKTTLREVDIVARWIGETFIVLLPETELGESTLIAERLRKLIETQDFNKGNEIIASFGVTEYEENDDDQKLIERAKEYLFESKHFDPEFLVHH